MAGLCRESGTFAHSWRHMPHGLWGFPSRSAPSRPAPRGWCRRSSCRTWRCWTPRAARPCTCPGWWWRCRPARCSRAGSSSSMYRGRSWTCAAPPMAASMWRGWSLPRTRATTTTRPTGFFRRARCSSRTAPCAGPTSSAVPPHWRWRRSTCCCATATGTTTCAWTPPRHRPGATASRWWACSARRCCALATATGNTGTARCLPISHASMCRSCATTPTWALKWRRAGARCAPGPMCAAGRLWGARPTWRWPM